MPDKSQLSSLTTIIAVITVGGLCVGWVGGRTVDYMLDDVRDNTMFRVEQKRENIHLKEEIEGLKSAIKDFSEIKEAVIRMDMRLQQWEPKET